MPDLFGDALDSVAVKYVPDHGEIHQAGRYLKSAFTLPLDRLIRWSGAGYAVISVAAALAVAILADRLLFASGSLIFWLCLSLAAYLWTTTAAKWRNAYFFRRAATVFPLAIVTVQIDDAGLHMSSDDQSMWLAWSTISDAIHVAEGVFVKYGMHGLLIPERAFPDRAQQESFVAAISEKVKGSRPTTLLR